MKVLTAPHRIYPNVEITIFLAGSIEMGEASNWQKEAITQLDAAIPREHQGLYQILNPRRPDWDSNWKQEYENAQFFQQVLWELKGLEQANFVLVVFDPTTKSPVSMLELGAFHQKAVVVCPEGFWRKGNVDIFCEKFNVPQYNNLDEAIEYIIGNSKQLW